MLEQPTSAEFSDYERHALEDQLFKAYLRSKDFQQARKLAAERQKRDFESLNVAIVDAAIGDFAAARQTALQIAKEDETAAQFYADEDVGHVFLSSVFDELHEQYPINNFYEITSTGVVFVAAEPWKLTAEELAAFAERTGVNTVAPITAVRSVKPTVTAAFVIPLVGANIWVATGTGQFDPNWEFHDETQALAKTVKDSPYWLAWGTAGWNHVARDEIAQPMRNLAAESAAGKAQAIFAKEPQAWVQYRVYASDPEHLELWRLAGDLESVRAEGLDVVNNYEETSVASDRQFENQLREVAGRCKSTPGTDLELLVNLNHELGLGPLRLQVTDVNRKYDSQEFVGQLVVSSELIPELRQGLPIAVHAGQVHAWQLEAEPAVFRRK